MINSATDHGYNTDWTVEVRPGLEFRHVSAEGNHDMRVARRHRDPGLWVCVWLSGPREHGIWIRSESAMLRDVYAD